MGFARTALGKWVFSVAWEIIDTATLVSISTVISLPSNWIVSMACWNTAGAEATPNGSLVYW